jgi:hypothetical protein
MPHPPRRWSGELWAKLAVTLLFVVLAVLRLAAIRAENVNWDEFALLDRVARSFESQQLLAGGRPGLAVVHLMPLVEGCEDEIATIRRARWLWTGWTILLLAGFWRLMVIVRRAAPHPWRGAALAVGMLVLVPVFLRWSIQVRTDQPALACALWGGVAMLASRRRPALAAVAGALFAIGFLFSQKAVYAVALVGLLTVAELVVERDLRWRREIGRGLQCGLTAAAAAVLYLWLVSTWREQPTLVDFEAGFDVFDFYRRAVGNRVYLGMLPTLGGHFVFGALFAVACLFAVGRRGRGGGVPSLAVALALLLLGWAVARFHAGAFPYFWMTLGLFPAAVAGYALEAAVDWLPGRRAQLGAVGVIAALLVASGLPAAVRLLADTQSVQAESLAFIGRHFGPGEVGFHPERAPFCRALESPFPTYFSQHIVFRFRGDQGEENTQTFLEEFRTRHVRYILDSHRLRQFPAPILRFWARNYGIYHSRVLLPARPLAGTAGEEEVFEAVAPGPYTWHQRPEEGMGSLAVDGATVPPDGTIDLAAGEHRASFSGGRVHGTLWLEVGEAPDPTTEPFYSDAVLAEFDGIRPPWPRALLGFGPGDSHRRRR